jgi:hypothetical protein
MPLLLDIQNLALLEEPEAPRSDRVLDCDVLVAGGGTGGCAAALAACSAGRSVILTEETDWLGGQFTSQGVSALDEHRFIEQFGATRSYAELRTLIRTYYRQHTRLAEPALAEAALNPGGGWVSRLCFEPRAGLWALAQMMAPHRVSGRLRILTRHAPTHASMEGDRVSSVTFRHLDSLEHVDVRATFVLDATEPGALLPLTGTEYRSGVEGAEMTGEPSAAPTAAPHLVQSFTYPFVVEWMNEASAPVAEPPGYGAHRDRQPYTLRHLYYDQRGWVTYRMLDTGCNAAGPFWTYRRLIDAARFHDSRYPHDLSMINWPGNDFRHGNLIDVDPAAARAALIEAQRLSLGFCRWLQTECPRDDGGVGYPEFVLRPDVMGTPHGFSKYPYIREARRIRALTTILETDISAAYQPGVRAAPFSDSGGVGLYAIDIHPAEGEAKIPPAPARPFQIPMSALVPVATSNLLAACKNIGTTHITNGAYRLHPVEWNIGETAGHLAAFCLDRGLSPRSVVTDARRTRRLQRRLVRAGVPIYWYPDVALDDPGFEAVQLLGAWDVWSGEADRLEFDPSGSPDGRVLARVTAAPAWARERVAAHVEQHLSRWMRSSRASLARSLYEAICV